MATNNIRAFREKSGLSQRALAEMIGATQGAVGHYENGRRTPSLSVCRIIVAAFRRRKCKCSIDDVFPIQKTA